MTSSTERHACWPSFESGYLAGIRLFNLGEFYECHDVWEELWTEYRGPDRSFYQGLIQTAVALYHLGRGNRWGARRMYHSSRAYLDPYRPLHLGLDLERLFLEMQRCCENLHDEARPVIASGPLPRIRLLPLNHPRRLATKPSLTEQPR